MKQRIPAIKLIAVVACCFLSYANIYAQYVTIPDTNFVKFLKQEFPACMNGNQMDTTCSGIINKTRLVCQSRNVVNFYGLQYFDKVDTLYCSVNAATSLPALPPLLRTLECGSNKLTSLPPLPPTLGHLHCGWNNLNALPTLPASLRYLAAHSNKLSTVPTLPAFLDLCDVSYNQLTAIPTLPNYLRSFSCQSNQVTSLPTLPATLRSLVVDNNQLTALPALPPGLENLWCQHNQITSLPILPKSLTALMCTNNRLSSIPSLPARMERLGVADNINLSCLPPIEELIGSPSIYISGTSIKCLPNRIKHTDSFPWIDTLPICDIFNENGCEAAWNIQGSVFHDANSDCSRQTAEITLPAVKMNLFQGTSLVESGYFSSGNYSFNTGLGTYRVAPDVTGLPLVPSCKQDTTLVVDAADSMKYNIDFSIECKPGFDIGVKSISGSFFRPANNTTINIIGGDMVRDFGVQCASATAGVVIATISGPAKYISKSNGALTPASATDSTIIWNIADFSTINSKTDFGIVLKTDTLAQMSQQVCITVSVIPATVGDNDTTNNKLVQCFPVRTSYDPNDKAAYPSGNTDTAQKWITYTVRFQNTGNDTAIHIYIMDTLSTNLDVASFQLLASSHKNITQVMGSGVVRFNFPNIMLPDSNVNEELSHGYVQYKVKRKDDLLIGTQILNTAYIYFDFNAPVVTNTTLNTITAEVATGTGIELNRNIDMHLFPNPASSQLNIIPSGFQPQWISLLDINGRRITEQRFSTILDIASLSPGIYFIELRSAEGIARKKFVKQ